MDDAGREKVDVDPVTEFTTESSCWRTVLGDADSVDNVYFFGTTSHGRDTHILSDFGWNLPPPPNPVAEPAPSHGGFDPIIDSDLAGNDTTSLIPPPTTSTALAAAAATTSTSVATALADVEAEPQPMVSSSSSEDLPEKSTASGGPAHRPPTETA